MTLRTFAVRLAAAAALVLLAPGCANTGAIGLPTADEQTTTGPAAHAYFAPEGWETVTTGGAGGRIVRVTTLAADGPGSLRAALSEEGPRIVVFEVGGVIDLGRSTINLANPFVTIAGQTAPSPGITLIRGGIDIRAHDVIVQHIRVRPGDVGEGPGTGWGEDAISTVGAYNVIVDHCSLTWATDENLSASGPRFTGQTPDEWREGASHRILFSHNIIAEGLANSTHPKYEHSKGSLIHDNTSEILIYANLYAHNTERSPLFKGGVHGAIVNNFIFNPGQRAIHYNLQGQEWGDVPYERGEMTVIGNVMRAGMSTAPGLPLIMLGGDGDLALYERDNVAVDRWGAAAPTFGRYTTSAARIVRLPQAQIPLIGLSPLPANRVESFVLTNAGARPWDRDGHDVRVLADAAEGRGHIIDSQDEVGGYPHPAATRRAFDPQLWDMSTMSPRSGEALDAGARARGT